MILSSADYDAIRALLAADTLLLPDATLDLILPITDREIKRLAPAWAGYTGDDLAALQDAARLLTAARLPGLSSDVSGLGYSIKAATVSPDALLSLAYAALRALGLTFSTAHGFAVQGQRSDGYTARNEWG